MVTAVLFLLLGAIDRVGIQLPSLVSGDEAVRTAVAAMLPIRAAVLKSTVVALGVFAWSTTRASGGRGIATGSWKALGWVVLATSVLFVFVFVPAPWAFAVWGIGLTIRTVVTGRGTENGERVEAS